MPYDPQMIASTIRQLADKAGSQRQLAARARLDPKTINNAINRTNGMTLQTACMIADAAGITVAELIGESPRIDPETRALAERVLHLVEQAEDMVPKPDASENSPPPRQHPAAGRRKAKLPRS